jgi:membrane fusion protein, multidrug efflux system
MQKQIKYIFTIAIIVFAVACSSKKDAEAKLNDQKVKLEKLKAESSKNAAEIKKMQEEITKADTANGKKGKVKLVATSLVLSQNFNHYIDLQGVVNAENISYISPRGMPGQVRAIYIKEGQYITKGQLVLKLDNAIINQQVQASNQQAVAAKQQLEGIKTQLAFAKNILVRQQNLWNQGIGTEVQLLTAKTNVQALENQLSGSDEQVKSVYEQVKIAKEQLNTSNVYSDVSGVVEDVNVRVGETFSGMGMMGAQIKVVNKSALKVTTTISENYIGRINKGSIARL